MDTLLAIGNMVILKHDVFATGKELTSHVKALVEKRGKSVIISKSSGTSKTFICPNENCAWKIVGCRTKGDAQWKVTTVYDIHDAGCIPLVRIKRKWASVENTILSKKTGKLIEMSQQDKEILGMESEDEFGQQMESLRKSIHEPKEYARELWLVHFKYLELCSSDLQMLQEVTSFKETMILWTPENVLVAKQHVHYLLDVITVLHDEGISFSNILDIQEAIQKACRDNADKVERKGCVIKWPTYSTLKPLLDSYLDNAHLKIPESKDKKGQHF